LPPRSFIAAALACHLVARVAEAAPALAIEIASDGVALDAASEQLLRDAISARLDEAPPRALVHIALDGDHARIAIGDAARSLSLEGRRGDAAVRLLVLHVADLALQPALATVDRPVAAAAVVATPAPPAEELSSLWIGVAPVAGHFVSAWGGAGAGISGRGEVRVGRTVVGLSAGWLHGLRDADDYASYDLFPIALRGGVRLGGVELGGSAFVAPLQFAGVSQRPAITVGVGGHAAYVWPLTERLEVVGEIGADVFGRRVRLMLDGRDIYTMPLVTGRVLIGVAWRLAP
jgi:hypothetical protein